MSAVNEGLLRKTDTAVCLIEWKDLGEMAFLLPVLSVVGIRGIIPDALSRVVNWVDKVD